MVKGIRQRAVDDLVSVLDTDYLDMELVPPLRRWSSLLLSYMGRDNPNSFIDYAL